MDKAASGQAKPLRTATGMSETELQNEVAKLTMALKKEEDRRVSEQTRLKEKTRETFHRMKDEYNTRVITLNTEVAEMKKEAKEREAAKKASAQDWSVLSEQHVHAERDMETLRKAVKVSEQRCLQFEGQVVDVEKFAEEQRLAREEQAQEVAVCSAQAHGALKEVEAEVDALREQVAEQEARQAGSSELQRERDEDRCALATAQDESSTLQAQLGAARSRIEELRDQESSSTQRFDVLTGKHSELRGAMEGLEKNEQQVLDQASEEHSRSLISLTEELSQARSEHTLESERVQSLLCERVATNQNEFHLNGLQVELVKQEEELDKARLFEARAFAESAALEVEVATARSREVSAAEEEALAHNDEIASLSASVAYWQSEHACILQRWQQSEEMAEGAELHEDVMAKFTEEVSEAEASHAAEIARHQELLEEQTRLADDRLVSLGNCQSENFETTMRFDEELQELTTKATMEAAVAEKLKVMAHNQIFELEQEMVQVREEAGEERERVQIVAAEEADRLDSVAARSRNEAGRLSLCVRQLEALATEEEERSSEMEVVAMASIAREKDVENRLEASELFQAELESLREANAEETRQSHQQVLACCSEMTQMKQEVMYAQTILAAKAEEIFESQESEMAAKDASVREALAEVSRLSLCVRQLEAVATEEEERSLTTVESGQNSVVVHGAPVKPSSSATVVRDKDLEDKLVRAEATCAAYQAKLLAVTGSGGRSYAVMGGMMNSAAACLRGTAQQALPAPH